MGGGAWWQCYLDGAGEGTSGFFFPVCYLAEIWAHFAPVSDSYKRLDDDGTGTQAQTDNGDTKIGAF
jgi:hypothetical protein